MPENNNYKNTDLPQTSRDNAPPPPSPKASRRGWLFILLALLFIIIIILTERKASIPWRHDYQAALDQARDQNKFALIAFHKIDINACFKMKNNTYANDNVINYVEKRFIPVLLDADEHKKLVRQHNITSFPGFIILNPRNNKTDRRQGYQDAELFIEMLDKSLKKIQ